MTTLLMAKSKMALAAITALSGPLIASPALAQSFPITPGQKATASEVAQKGVALSELADNAPERYTVKSGDTLWAISSQLFLKSPWRWPELWGMNLDDIKNPHRIYPGQVLVLERSNGRATLKVAGASADSTEGLPTVRLSPPNTLRSAARQRADHPALQHHRSVPG